MLKAAQGDEEIPNVVAGIILAHEIPHLSHLAVRARQGHVVLVCCEENAEFAKFAQLKDGWAVLDATPHGATLEPRPPASELSSRACKSSSPMQPLEVCLNVVSRCISLDHVTPQNGGHKAAALRGLEALSQDRQAGFLVPPGVVIPFGVMEDCMRSMPQVDGEYSRLRDGIDNLSAEEFKIRAERLRILIGHLRVPEEVVATVAQKLGGKHHDNQ